MVRRIGPESVPQPSKIPSADVSKALKAVQQKTMKFMRDTGFSKLGAGRTHFFTKKPTREAGQVKSVAQQHFIPFKPL